MGIRVVHAHISKGGGVMVLILETSEKEDMAVIIMHGIQRKSWN
jgi:hypothetical protein